MNRLLLTPILVLLFFSRSAGQSYRAQMDAVRTPFLIDIEGNISNRKKIKLSSLEKEILYIPLETRPECLIDEIYKVELNESYIFVSAFTRLLQFDNNGIFIRQIGSQGRGPAEYLSVKDFCIDNERKEVLIISNGRLMTFSFDGKFKRSDNISFRPAQVILMDPNSIMYHLFNITTLPDGSINSGFNKSNIGTISTPLINLIHKEIENPTSWLNIINHIPCNSCVYQWLCPSPSGYELAIGKANLCHRIEL
jgi:hypothetical protein